MLLRGLYAEHPHDPAAVVGWEVSTDMPYSFDSPLLCRMVRCQANVLRAADFPPEHYHGLRTAQDETAGDEPAEKTLPAIFGRLHSWLLHFDWVYGTRRSRNLRRSRKFIL